jgi:hypothetical protein
MVIKLGVMTSDGKKTSNERNASRLLESNYSVP